MMFSRRRERKKRWELIGPPSCPNLYRWTIFSCRLVKLMVNRFVAGSSDPDPHDHPSSFLTIVLTGGYDDISPCQSCDGDGVLLPDDAPCKACGATGTVVDKVLAPTVRYRPADHAHVTKVGPDGATTVCIMGPKRRDWGFFRDGLWWRWKDYEREFGLDFRCDDE